MLGLYNADPIQRTTNVFAELKLQGESDWSSQTGPADLPTGGTAETIGA